MDTVFTSGLARSFGRTVALRDLTMRVPQGSIYGFLGRNGAGKTTALRILMGIVDRDRGELHLFGERRKAPTLQDRRRIGFVAQEPAYYTWMHPAELGRFAGSFYPRWDQSEFDRLLALFDVPPRRISALSGGTRAKLSLALALGHRPDLLILDEPTAGLDPVAQREFLDLVVEISRGSGSTVLFSSHRVDEVQRVADVVGILEAGTLCFEGSPATLVAELRAITDPALELPETLQPIGTDRRTGERYARGPAAAWDLLPSDRVRSLSLEDAFLALVSRAVDRP